MVLPRMSYLAARISENAGGKIDKRGQECHTSFAAPNAAKIDNRSRERRTSIAALKGREK